MGTFITTTVRAADHAVTKMVPQIEIAQETLLGGNRV
jgi:hypothetical protein